MSLFQNSVSFEKGSGKTVLKASFSFKSKVGFPKTEVLENPPISIIIADKHLYRINKQKKQIIKYIISSLIFSRLKATKIRFLSNLSIMCSHYRQTLNG